MPSFIKQFRIKNYNILMLLIMIITFEVQSGITVYVQDPFRNDPAPVYSPNPIVIYGGAGTTTGGYRSGIVMKDIGNDWYSFTYKDSYTINNSEILKISRRTKTQWDMKEDPIYSGTIASLFGTENMVWIKDETSGQVITDDYTKVTGATKINVLNPWPDNSSKIIIGSDTIQMHKNNNYTGWYSHIIMKTTLPDIKFTDYYKSESYGQGGIGSTDIIDISSLQGKNEIFVWPEPKYDGPAKISSDFPAVFGQADTMSITALIHDLPQSDNSFEEGFASDNVTKNIAGDNLDSNGKIVKGSSSAFNSDDMPTWFETKILAPDIINDTCVKILLKKADDGSWEFNSDNDGGFFPIDDFNPYVGIDATEQPLYYGHNFSFTMELRTEFDYHEGSNQVFAFDGDDDVWVYINGKLAIDLGGPHPAKSDSVNLDNIKSSFGLDDGKTYNLDMFYCERECWEPGPEQSANFRMKTTINLENISSLFYDIDSTDDVYKLIVKKKKIGEFGSDCGINVHDTSDIEIIPADLDQFILYGPQFGNSSDTLKIGSIHYNGINIKSGNEIDIDTTSITGLKGGVYTLVFVDGGGFSGNYKFTVSSIAPIAVDTSKVRVTPDPNIVIYSTNSLDVNFTTDSDCEIFYEVLQGNSTPTGSGKFSGTGSIAVSDDTVKIRTWANGNSSNQYKYSSDTSTYTFVREYPPVILFADTSVVAPDSCVYRSPNLSVDFTVVVDGDTVPLSDSVKIYYTIDGSNIIKGVSDYGSSVTFSGDINLKAAVYVTGRDSVAEQWFYDQQLPSSYLIASPSVAVPDSFVYTSATLDIDLALVVEGDTLLPSDSVRIFYTLDGTLDTNLVSTKELFAGDKIEIIGNDTLLAMAFIKFAENPKDGMWYYYQDLLPSNLLSKSTLLSINGSNLILTSNDKDTVHFGHSINVNLVSVSDSIKYLFDSNDPLVSGTIYSSLITIDDAIPFPDPSIDTITITAVAFDAIPAKHRAEKKSFIFIRDTVETVQISGTTKFTDSTLVKIGLSKKWQNSKIYFTTDGTTPNKSSTLYMGKFSITASSTVKAIAFADNAVESIIITADFIKVAAVSSAYYKDINGDGAIDRVEIFLSKKVKSIPDSIILTSPFNSTEKIKVVNAILEDSTKITADLSTPFSFERKSTSFSDMPLGQLNGAEYWDYFSQSLDSSKLNSFMISDSVAPVITMARYKPVEIKKESTTPEILDTLIVTFSEELGDYNFMDYPFSFWDFGKNRITNSPLKISNEVSRNGSVVTFLAVADNSFLPENGKDSIRINETAKVIDSKGSVQEVNTYWVPMFVDAYRYSWDVQIFPNPYSHTIPSQYVTEAFAGIDGIFDIKKILGIFIVPIGNRSIVGTVNADLVIFDALGNVIHRANGDTFQFIEKLGGFVHIIEPKNRKGRKLGSGSYSAKIHLRIIGTNGEESDEFVKNFAIGIKE